MTPEFSRTVRVDTLGAVPRTISIEASPSERAVLAARLGLAEVASLEAEFALTRSGATVAAHGRLAAQVTQCCVATAEPVPARIEERFTLTFRPQPAAGEAEEIELSEGELDVVFYAGAMLDVGEVAAETLGLSLDPYPRAPDAEAALRAAGVLTEEEAKPAGALAGLKDLLKPES